MEVDYEIEQFWLNFKKSLLNFYNQPKINYTRPIDKWSSHLNELQNNKKYKVTEYKKMKSSLKFCVIASGEFDFYAAEPRACEWDIAAGHAILKNAGGIITDFDGNEINYGKIDFKNPSLILKRGKIL